MKKPLFSGFAVLTALFAVFTLGLFLGRNFSGGDLILSVPASMQTAPEFTVPETTPETDAASVVFPININTADRDTLMALPGIGEVLAQRIITYRDAHGPFEGPEGLMAVEGIGDTRMKEIWNLVITGG